MKDSKIEWTTHTFNPWRGCTKVSDGCKHCYAETLSKRVPLTLSEWGPKGTRVVASESMWKEPLKWNAAFARAGFRNALSRLRTLELIEGRDRMKASSDLF